MGQVLFGQPDDGIIQMAYVVEDIHKSMELWASKLKVGPWFLLPHFTGDDPLYRGNPSRADIALAMSFSGHMNIELLQPNDDAPSVYREHIERRGYGFHHWGIATRNFERDLARYKAMGHETAFICGVPSGGHVAYMDTVKEMGGYTELIELGPGFDGLFGRFHRASIDWDGKEPVRSFIPGG